MSEFKPASPYKPTGFQLRAIAKLLEGLESGREHTTTGGGVWRRTRPA